MNSAIQIKTLKHLSTAVDVLHLTHQNFIEACQYTDKTVTLEIEHTRLEVGHLLSLEGQIQIGEKSTPFTAIGKVKNSSPLFNRGSRVEIYLQQFERTLWAQFLESKTQAQNKVDSLLLKIKGEVV